MRLAGRKLLRVDTRRVPTNAGRVTSLEAIVLEGATLRFMVHECEGTTTADPYVVSVLARPSAAAETPTTPEGPATFVTVTVGGRTVRFTAAQWHEVAGAMHERGAGELDPHVCEPVVFGRAEKLVDQVAMELVPRKHRRRKGDE